MKLYVGLDLSLNKTAVCVMDDGGKTVFEGNALSEPEDLIARLERWRDDIALIGLEACPLSEWIYAGLVLRRAKTRGVWRRGTRSASFPCARTRRTGAMRTASPR